MDSREMAERSEELYRAISATIARLFRERTELDELDIAAFSVLSSAEFAAMSLESFAVSLARLEAQGFKVSRQSPAAAGTVSIPLGWRSRN